MNNRIHQIRKSLNLTLKDFAAKIGLSYGTLSDIENGKISITERTIISICSIYNVNEKWLRSGQGEMFITNKKNFDEFFSTFNNLHPVLQDYLIKSAKNLLDAQNNL